MHRVKPSLLRSFLFISLLTFVGQAGAQSPAMLPTVPLRPHTVAGSPGPAQPVSAHAALTAEDVGAFLDGALPLQLRRENIAGATVAVVKDGTVLFANGYGFSDVKSRKPISADETLFRPGSISKLFTWTAVMQQVQAGKIDLDRNVNEYLDFKIAETYPAPITMRHLMTHTGGFEEAVQDLISLEPKDMVPLGQYLRTHQPARINPPGVTPAYSNYGASLAGYIVQRVSGMPFDQYVTKNIFEPLSMQHSTFQQPLAERWKSFMSSGYQSASESPKPFEFVVSAPAGALTSTATDMARFMLAHLQDGEYNGARILDPATAQLMHSRQFAPNPATHGMCLGFYEQTRNGQRIIAHAGDTMYFHSNLFLLPDAHVGIFISYNSGGSGQIDARSALFNQFLDRYFPYTAPAATPQATAHADALSVAGQYVASRGGFTNMLSFLGAFGEATVAAKPDGTITLDTLKNLAGKPQVLEEIGPLVYRVAGGQDIVAFSKNASGGSRLSIGYPFEVYDRVSWPSSRSFNYFLLIFMPLVFLFAVVIWPASAWMRRHYGSPLMLTGRQRRNRTIVRLVCLVDLLYFLVWAGLGAVLGSSILFNSHAVPWLRLIQVIGWIGSVGTIIVVFSLLSNLRVSRQWWLSRIGDLIILCACVSFSWFLYHWHLLHFSLRF